MRQSIGWTILARYLSNECNETQRKKVEDWMASDPRHRNLMNLMADAWKAEEKSVPTSDIRCLWSDMAAKADIIPGKSKNPARVGKAHVIRWPFAIQPAVVRALWIAAVLIAAVALPYLLTDGFKTLPFLSRTATFAVAETKRAELVLSDGSRIVLDSGSELSYPKKFTGRMRDVLLKGEGYFEVAPDKEKPFVVHAGGAVIRVLGTRFDVRAWERNRRVVVAVAEGRVSFGSENCGDQEKVILTRNQESELTGNGKPDTPREADVEKILGWMHDRIEFENAPLGEVLFQVERWYGIRFTLADSSAADERVSVSIQKKSIGDVLELISMISGLEYQMKGSRVRLEAKLK